jgi:hypothetical protein
MQGCPHRSREDALADTMTLRCSLLRVRTAFYCEDAPAINAGMPLRPMRGCLQLTPHTFSNRIGPTAMCSARPSASGDVVVGK